MFECETSVHSLAGTRGTHKKEPVAYSLPRPGGMGLAIPPGPTRVREGAWALLFVTFW